jgi:hypothetical protein
MVFEFLQKALNNLLGLHCGAKKRLNLCLCASLPLAQRQRPVIIAMVAVGVVKPAANQIVDMVSVWDSLVAAAWTVAMCTAAGIMIAAVGVLIADLDDVLVNMPVAGMMQMAIVKVIDVISMEDRCVSTVRAMLVCGGACHDFISSRSGASKVWSSTNTA